MHTCRTDFEQRQKERVEVVPGDSYRCQITFPLSSAVDGSVLKTSLISATS